MDWSLFCYTGRGANEWIKEICVRAHTRTAAGYYENGFKLITIYDLYPVNQGDVYWDVFDIWNLNENRNIYVY